jgi:predicted transcriptional regulator
MMEVKRVTIRLSPALHRQLRQAAIDQSLSLNSLAVQALEDYVQVHAEQQNRLPLRQLAAFLAPAAEASDITEEELLQHARRVRRRIWQERYEKAVQAYAKSPEIG